MKVRLTEGKYAYMLFNKALDNLDESYHPFSKAINNKKERLREWLNMYGAIKQDMTNNSYYIIYRIPDIEKLLGTSYCICRIIDNDTNKPTGQVVVKPLDCFLI